jgi:hypothetical protein
MAKIRFYRQQRYDGGLRTGFGVDDQAALHDYRAGNADSDPALLWYVDVELDGKGLPNDTEDGRVWVLENDKAITDCLRSLGQRLQIGLDDTTEWPYLVKIPNLPRGVRGEVRVSAVRGLAEGEIADRLSELADNWKETIQRLSPMSHV